MARSDVIRYFEMAAKLALSPHDSRNFLLAAIAHRGDGTLVKSRNGSTSNPNRCGHAEFRLTKKLDPGTTVYVVRLRLLDKAYAMARPCVNCQKALLSRHVERVFYSINENQYGIWDVKKDTDKIYNLKKSNL